MGRDRQLRSVVVMNSNHARVCASPEWAEFLQSVILPAVTRDVDLGQRMLEIGPGPGAATEWLRHRVQRLTAVEINEAAAKLLADKYAGTNVEIIVGTGTALGYPDDSFDSVGSFTMLHHVPTVAQQNKIFSEALRVLRPGGVLFGSDSLASTDLHHFHADDSYNPVDPATVIGRLQTIGFDRVTVAVDLGLRFAAWKAAGQQPDGEDAARDSNDQG